MELIANLSLGFSVAISPETLLFCFLGVLLGTLIGVLPGIGSLAAVAMLLPISYHLEPMAALVLLAGVYYGAEYGGSTASILLNLPGTPSSAVTCLDGYPMARKGKAGVALFTTTIASFVGGAVGIILLTSFAPALARVALAFGAADFFAVMLLGLVAAAAIGQGAPIKGIAMVFTGVLLGTVGTDLNTGADRYTYGFFELMDGISIMALAMGLFGLAEIIVSIHNPVRVPKDKVTLRSMLPSRAEARAAALPIARGAGLGSFFGVLPGTGQSIASFMSYAVEKRVSGQPERFGTGAIEGISGPEAASNAAVQTSFIPTLTMGIPGSATMALMLGALMMHGITPGPRLLTDHADIFWGLVVSFWVGNILLVVLNIPMIGIWVRLLRVPYQILYPGIIVLILIGVFSVNNSVFDVYVAVGFGLLGYAMRILGFEPAPLLVGFVLGPMMEENFRRALIIGRGDFMTFFQQPISGSLLVLTGLLLVWSLWASVRPRKAKKPAQ
ncbi:MAG TPA: tripartite tricarboxylate transporter permease [Paracoccus sp.]|nr:tripartite tricarboxylate transporter permease [Paracoccus sp. (in: a-proteobacteria)]